MKVKDFTKKKIEILKNHMEIFREIDYVTFRVRVNSWIFKLILGLQSKIHFDEKNTFSIAS